MITIYMWKRLYYEWFTDALDYTLTVIATLFTIPIDILLFPFEVIGFIIYKIIERD